uniref:Uncharacterized protein n=1 Tax=Rhizophagus irregularis (strain DAOM 181602 / DAOM 197198 / MUCL 43194) TaxID=747089 RepID=U9UKM3_RHIID
MSIVNFSDYFFISIREAGAYDFSLNISRKFSIYSTIEKVVYFKSLERRFKVRRTANSPVSYVKFVARKLFPDNAAYTAKIAKIRESYKNKQALLTKLETLFDILLSVNVFSKSLSFLAKISKGIFLKVGILLVIEITDMMLVKVTFIFILIFCSDSIFGNTFGYMSMCHYQVLSLTPEKIRP